MIILLEISKQKGINMRNNFWLQEKLNFIWQNYFNDIAKMNNIQISFGRKARRRLASIRQMSKHDKSSDTSIKVTGYFRDEEIPEYVVTATLAHELCHYAQGFASPHPQYSKFPHRGDVVDSELRRRGLGKVLEMQEIWLKKNWNSYVGDQIFIYRKARRKRVQRKSTGFIRFLAGLGLADA